MTIRKHMPEISSEADFKATMMLARQLASVEHRRDKDGQLCRRVAIILPNRQNGLLESSPVGSMNPKAVQQIEKILPSSEPGIVVAIAFTKLDAPGSVEQVARAIPFIGFLLGFAYVGHNVVVFEGHSSSLAAGLSEADLAVVDAEMIPFLQKDWLDVAIKVMRKPQICIYQSSGQVQQIVRRPG
jgi:hypothetical protein